MGLYSVIMVSGLARRLSTYRLGAKQTWAVEQDFAKSHQDYMAYAWVIHAWIRQDATGYLL